MLRNLKTLLLGLSLFGNAFAADEQFKLVSAEIALDEHGKLSALEFSEPMPAGLETALRARIGHWEFSPLQGAQGPQAAKLQLHLSLGITVEGEQISTRVVDARTGLQFLHAKPPVYPRDQLRRRRDGQVLLRLVVDGNGQVVDATSAFATNPSFEKAALKAAKGYSFGAPVIDPEAAKGVRIEVLTPVGFFIPASPKNIKRPPLAPEIKAMMIAAADDSVYLLAQDSGGQLLSTDFSGTL